MHRRLTTLLIVSALAGCVDAPTPEPTPVETATITDPTDFDYNTSQAHVHDYWGGLDELVVFSRTGFEQSTTVLGDLGYTIRPDRDEVVPQGTAQVTMAWSWTNQDPAQTYGTPIAYVTTAAKQSSRELGPVAAGEPITIDVTNNDNDKPHARLSGWSFGLRFPQESPAVNRIHGDISLEVVAHRGLDIPEYPGHPDRWEGRDRIALVEYQGSTSGLENNGGRICVMGCPPTLASDDLVPHDADHVEVVLTAPGPIGDIGLIYHGADTWQMSPPEPVDASGGMKTYVLQVEGDGDGPYALKSLWEFGFVHLGEGGAKPYSGDLGLEAWAVKDPA